jgi:DNA-binding response OmpR family regulator
MTKILIIDKDTEICGEIKTLLEEEHFECQVEHDGIEGQKRFLEDDFDLILLAVILPGIRGLDLLKNIRKTSDIPIIIITSRTGEVDRVVGLELGADDYLVKPFYVRELLARINAVLRRYRREHHSLNAGINLKEFEGIRLDSSSRTAYLESNPLEITSVEYDFLESLMSRAGIVVSRETISQKVLRRTFTPLDRSVDVHISQLRKKIGSRPDGRPRIKTVRGSGYIFVTD